jgi:hypothetical protein
LQRIALGHSRSDPQQPTPALREIHDQHVLDLAIRGAAPPLDADPLAQVIAQHFGAVR